MIVSLERLLAHAEQNPDREYNLNSTCGCLAADATGGVMEDSERFLDGTKVHPRFAAFTRAIIDRSWQTAPSYERREAYYTYRGDTLAFAIRRLIEGDDPRIVAHDLIEQRSDHSED